MAKSFASIVSSMISYIRSLNSQLDTSEGTVLNDIMVGAPAQQIANLYTDLDTISSAQALDTASDSAMDKLGANYGLVRKDARSAVGSVTFFANSAPTANIPIPAGTVVATTATSANPAIQFTTTQDVLMDIGLVGSYLNPATGKYEVTATVESTIAGTVGNVGSNAITSLANPIVGINGVYNALATSGGFDTESSVSFSTRIAAALIGNVVGTDDGYLTVALAQAGVEDATVVAHGQTGRMEFGAVDLYIKGQIIQFQSDTFLGTSDFVLTKQPVISGGISTVQSSASGSLANWSLVKDTGVYAGSIDAQDTLHWTTPIDSTYGTIFVSYSYNSLVEGLQNLFSKTNLDVLDTSLLVKWATVLPINLTCSVRISAGFDANSTVAQVLANVANFLNVLGIGQAVLTSDLVLTIRNTTGVDDVVTPFTVFQSQDGSVVPDANDNLVIPADAYATAGALTFNITTTL